MFIEFVICDRVINAGKTKVNEDQARAEILLVPKHKQSDSTEDIINGEVNEAIKQKELVSKKTFI